MSTCDCQKGVVRCQGSCEAEQEFLWFGTGIQAVVYASLSKCFSAMGFWQCLADSCVVRLVEGGELAMHLVVHVDDIFAVGKKDE